MVWNRPRGSGMPNWFETGLSAVLCKTWQVCCSPAWIWKMSWWFMALFKMKSYVEYFNGFSAVCRWSVDWRQQSELHFVDQEGAEQLYCGRRSWWGEYDFWYGNCSWRKTEIVVPDTRKILKNIYLWSGMEMARTTNTPMQGARNYEKRLEGGTNDFCNWSISYRWVVGFLVYLMIGSGPDIAFAVGKLSKFCECPKNNRWIAFKHVLRYICGSNLQEYVMAVRIAFFRSDIVTQTVVQMRMIESLLGGMCFKLRETH